MAIVILAGLFGHLIQNGFMLVGDNLTPKFTKLDPLKGIKRLVSLRALVELCKSIFKIIIIGGVRLTSFCAAKWTRFRPWWDIHSIMGFIGRVSLKLGYYICLVLIVLAALDYLFQHWKHERDLRMSKQEIKDEYKQREGDP